MPNPGSGGGYAAAQIHQDEVLTGEAVALDIQPVGFFLRALGALIDIALSVALLVAFLLAMTWLLGEGWVDDAALPIAAIAVLVIVTVVLPTAVETVTRGRSLGRLAIGGRIVRVDGGASGFRQAFIRALVGVFEIWLTVGAVAALVGAFTPRGQRLGDLVAGTYCERTRVPKLVDAPPQLPAPLVPWAATADVARLPDPIARRIAQFARQAGQMEPGARARLGETLAAEVRPFVSPVPDVPPEVLLRAVTALRHARELHALEGENARVASLVGPSP